MRRIKSFLIIICMLSIYAASFYGCGKKEWSDSHNNEAGLPEITIRHIIMLIQMAMLLELMLSLLRKHLKEWVIRPDSYILTGKIRRIFLLTEQLIVHGEALAWTAGRMNTDGQDLIYSLEDLEGKTIAVQTTTRPEKIFLNKTDERIPAIRSLIALQKRELIYPFLSKGYADALAAHETAIRQYMEDYNIKFRILDEPLETVGLGVAFDKNDDRGIEKQLTEILNQMRNDGTEKKIISRYIPDADKYLEVDSYGK